MKQPYRHKPRKYTSVNIYQFEYYISSTLFFDDYCLLIIITLTTARFGYLTVVLNLNLLGLGPNDHTNAIPMILDQFISTFLMSGLPPPN